MADILESVERTQDVFSGPLTHGDNDQPTGTPAKKVTGNSRADRPTSYQLSDFPMPTGREEEWRFTPLDRIDSLFADDLPGTTPILTIDGHDVQAGTIAVDDNDVATTADYVDRDDERVGFTEAPGDRTSVVEWNNIDSALVVTIGRGYHSDTPIVMRLDSDDPTPRAQHVVVICEEEAEATLVIVHSGKAQLNQGIEVDIRDSAKLTLVTTQEWDLDATHASNHRIRVGKDATLKHIVISFGGDLVRICSDVAFDGTGATVDMLGLYYTDTKQHHEHRLFVDHNYPNCYSRVNYKGALQGADAHSVWVGDVLIGKNGAGTDSYEENRNLVLTQGSVADSVPNLEIENGEIEGAGHASATGRFDDEQLFYLMSRGIDDDTARRLVVRGFFAELISQIGVESVQDHLMQMVEDHLDKIKEL